MAAPELLHSAPEIPRQLGELGQLFSPDSLHHLATTLRSLGHPYGLFLQTPLSDPKIIDSQRSLYSLSRGPGGSISSSYPPENSLILSYSCFLVNSFTCGLPMKSSAASVNSSDAILEDPKGFADDSQTSASRFTRGISGLVGKNQIDDFEGNLNKDDLVVAAVWLSPSLYSSSVKGRAEKIGAATEKRGDISYFVWPFAATLSLRDEPPENHYFNFEISLRILSLGSTSLKLSTYRGQEPFIVKTPDGKPIAEIQPGDPLAALHVSHQAARFRGLSPLEKAHAMVDDITQLLTAIDQTDPQTLNPDQQQALAKAKDATIIGISHLVRLFRRKTGLPTWKLDVLPPLLQRFHALDSQAVSNQFGGKRKVRPDDIEMLVITPSQRRQVLTPIS